MVVETETSGTNEDLEPEEQLYNDIKIAFGYPETSDMPTTVEGTDDNPKQQARDSIEDISEKLRDAIVAYVETQLDE